MKKVHDIYFTPGPSKAYPKLASFMQDAVEQDIISISHRGDRFKEIYADVDGRLRVLLDIPKDYYVFFFASATEIWERIAQNCIEKTSFHINNGIFGYRFVWAVTMCGKQARTHEVPYGQGLEEQDIVVPQDAELIAFTHNESSTGVMLDLETIAQYKKNHPDKLIAVDVVSSVPYPSIPFRSLDLVYFSVQKGFGLPAGLGVCVVSPDAFHKSAYLQRKGLSIGSYHNFQYLNKYRVRSQTPETPNVLNLYLFRRVLEDMCAVGIDKMRKDIDTKAELLYAYFDKHPIYQPFVSSLSERSKTLIVIKTQGDSHDIVQHCRNNGMIIGAGYGDFKDQHVRIANFPSHTMAEIHDLLDVFHTL